MARVTLDELTAVDGESPWRIVDARGRPQVAAAGSGALLSESSALGGALASLELSLPKYHWLEGECWLEGEEGADPVNIALCLAGRCEYRQVRGDSLTFHSGEMRVFWGKPAFAFARVRNGDGRFLAVDLSVGRSGLERLHEEGALPPPLAAIAEGREAPGELGLPLLPVFARISSELAASGNWGATGRIYREAKALELVAQLLHHWKPSRREGRARLNPLHRERIDSARDRLLEEMVDPPSIEQLAAEAGMGLTAFREGFRRRFGMPVQEYLRAARLERARTLINDGLPVQAAAHHVGYASEAAFSRAYRRYFGYPPSTGG